MWVMWNLVLVRLEAVLLSVQDNKAQVKLDLVYLKIVLILTQDRCTVYTECVIDSEILLDAPDGTPR
jgi:hypothetical protein